MLYKERINKFVRANWSKLLRGAIHLEVNPDGWEVAAHRAYGHWRILIDRTEIDEIEGVIFYDNCHTDNIFSLSKTHIRNSIIDLRKLIKAGE